MKFDGKKVGFALTGSFCTLEKTLPEMEKLISEGAEVFPIISESVDRFDTKFGTADFWKNKIKAITGKDIIRTIVEAEPIGSKAMFDLMIVAPCTGNTMSKIANAITDTSVTMASKAHLRNGRPLVLSIATNDGLGANAKNLGLLLNMKNVYFVPFFQDGPMTKKNSLNARLELIIPTIEEAFNGEQLEPVLIQ